MSLLVTTQGRRRLSPWWTSAAAKDRQRLIPPWMAVGLGLLVAGGLALTFPYRSLESRIARETRAVDPLHIEYLRLWLRARPDEHGLRMLLARQLAEIGDYAGARAELRALPRDADPQAAARMALLEIDIGLREAYALALDDPRRERLLAELREQLDAMTRTAWPPSIEIELAERAAQAGAFDAAAFWHERLLARDAQLSANAWEAAARRMAALGAPELAARLYFRAQSVAARGDEKRRLFVAALRTLAGAGLYDAALAAAEVQLGVLGNDTATLEFLTRFALAANRPDIAQRYATRLLRLSLAPAAIAAWLARFAAPVPGEWLALVDAPRLVRAQAEDAQPGERLPEPKLPFDDRIYTLSYEVFLANRNLKDALAVAQSAVRQAPKNAKWRLRLAQVADWTGNAALALEQWHAYARLTDDDAAWRAVLARAPQVFDYERWAEALARELRRRPDDLDTLRKLVQAYELLGEPDRAVALLRRHERGSHRREVLALLADLAERTGDDALRRATLQTLVREDPGNVGYAMRLAAAEAQRGDKAAALAALAAVAARASPQHGDFWDAYADLARQTGRASEAIRAYRRLIESGDAEEHHYAALSELLERDDPRAAAAVAAQAYLRFGHPYLARRTLYLYQRAGDAAATRAFLARLTDAQRSALARDAQFLYQRALFEFADGRPAYALADARAALRLEPDSVEFRALVVWALIALRDAPALRATLREWAAGAADEGELWAPFAAGWLALQEPAHALRYLRLKIKTTNDPLWWLNYADALDQMGEVDAAWRVRRHAWLALRSAAPAGDRERQREAETRRVALAAAFEPSDAARARMLALLHRQRGAGGVDAAARDAALGYWIGRGAAEIAQAWLLAAYANALERPAWARLSVALASDDRAELDDLLDTVADWLPAADRIEAAQRTGRTTVAQTLAFDRLALAPAHDDLHARLVALTTAVPPYAGFGWNALRQRPLRESAWVVDGAANVSPRLQLGVALHEVARESTDAAQLVGVPATERVQSLSARYDIAGNGELRAQLAARDGFGTGIGFVLQGERDVAPRLRLGLRLGFDDQATDNALLRIGGRRDTVGATAYSRLSQREFAAASFETNRYAALDGGAVGRGRIVRIEAGHLVRTEYPDVALRVTGADLRYSPQAGLDARLAALLPPAARAGATNAALLPASTTQFGIGIALGDGARSGYSRAWRPWAAAALLHDRTSGANTEWALGIGGSAFGADRLEFTAGGGSTRGAEAAPYRQFSVRYRWLF
ncbi:MAG: tetratricopeptide repeat protein [Pseudomonadota bacterium]